MNNVSARLTDLQRNSGSPRSAGMEAIAMLNAWADQLNAFFSWFLADCVMPTVTKGGLSVDSNAADIETDNSILIRHKGHVYTVAAASAIDVSATAAGGATIATGTHGVMWVFANPAGGFDCEVDTDAQAYTSAIAAWAAWLNSDNTLPPGTDDVPVGAVYINEGGSGAYTWGTDSITTESGTYHDFSGLPGVEVALASFALDTGAATFTYGAGKVRLGTGAQVAATGKANVTIGGSSILAGATGAYLLYILADDVELAQQIGAAYTSRTEALAAIQAHRPNPMLPIAGVITIENNSAATFVPGTTALDAAGITATFTVVGPGADFFEFGREAMNQAFLKLGQITDGSGVAYV